MFWCSHLCPSYLRQEAEKAAQAVVDRLLQSQKLYLVLDLDMTILHATEEPVDLDEYDSPEHLYHFTMKSGGNGIQNWHVKV